MISRKIIDQLIENTEDLNITITLPTYKKGEEVQQNPIRFKNLLNSVVKDLKKKDIKPSKINELLKKPNQLVDDLSFWNHTDEGLALYINNRYYQLFELPYNLNEQAYINNHFLITPLLPMLSLNGSYHILAISPKNLRLLKCTRNSVTEVTPDDIFTNIEDYIVDKPEVHLQFHTGADNMDAMYFGHGGAEEDKKLFVEKYLRGVEESVTKQLRISEDPLILVGAEEILSIYRSLNKYSRLLEESVTKYPGAMKNKELQEAGWDVIRTYFLKDMYDAIDKFKDGNTDRISNNLSEIVENTVMGKTDTLFIAKDEVSWGIYDEEEHTVHHYSNQDGSNNELLNWTALQAYEKGGKVFVLPKQEMPHASTVAALFRF